jgi:hypothetical protein
MILNVTKKWSILLYVMLLVNIALVVWIVVYNNSYVIVNNIDVWNNQEEVYSNIYNKWHIALESVIKYNTNGEWFLDGISCPQDITMSWSLNRTTWIPTTLVYQYWKVHCLGTYNWDDFKIHYDDEVNDFSTAQYEWDIVNVIESVGTEITVENSPINLSNWDISSSTPWRSYVKANSVDDNTSTWFDSNYRNSVEYLEYEVWSNQSIWKIVIRKPSHWRGWSYWDNWNIKFYNGSTQVFYTSLSWMKSKTYHEIDLKYRWLTNDVDSIRLETNWRYLDVSEFEVYLLNTISAWSELWEWDRVFTDSNNTLISFSKNGIEWNDGIDDDLNSDNYKVTSIWNTYFPNNYQDDDVVPRKTIFGSIDPNTSYQHVYWNNYKTIKIIDENTNNDDILNTKMWDTNNAHVFINTFNTEELDYNIKILEFDREVYKNQFTLLPLNSYEGKNIDEYLWYLQLNTLDWSLEVAKEKTWDEFVFDFQNKDYAIFFANNSNATLSYHLESYTDSWSWVYINPIDDSWTGTISVLSNHIIIWWEKNFIWENFEVVWSK